MPKPNQKTKKQRLARIRRRACCAGGRRTTGGTGHRRCIRQRRRAAMSSSECTGGPPVESGQLGRPHSVSRGLTQHMQLMLNTATPRRKTHIVVSASVVMMLMSQIMIIYFEPSNTSICNNNCTTQFFSGTDPRVCPGPDVAYIDVRSITNFRV